MLLAKGWGDANLAALSPALLPSVFAFLLATGSIAFAFPAFWWLVQASGVQSPPLRELARLHFVSQLMRHLPGRFIGVSYQIVVARHVASASQWVVANATYMAMALWFAATVPIILLLVVGTMPPEVSLLPLVVLVAGPLVAIPALGRVGHAEVRSGFWGKVIDVIVSVASSLSSRDFGRAFAWYAASWLVYGFAWIAFGMSLPGVGPLDGLVLCALYSLAWALGFLVIVTPSGLGVRELAFAAMARDFPPEVIAYTVVVARLGLLSADMLLGLLSLWIGRLRHA
jgi:uncharacterized membrane protein YbhN (UPF0104 family)